MNFCQVLGLIAIFFEEDLQPYQVIQYYKKGVAYTPENTVNGPRRCLAMNEKKKFSRLGTLVSSISEDISGYGRPLLGPNKPMYSLFEGATIYCN